MEAKQYLSLLTSLSAIFMSFLLTNAQVGINNTNPDAMVDISASNVGTPANTDGILVPRIDNFPATNPGAAQNGMLVFATGSGTPAEGFYFWDNSTTSWVPFVKSVDDLTDGRSDNDGTNNGSSIFLGKDAGSADDSSDNRNSGLGYEALEANTTGNNNVAVGYQSMHDNTTGQRNVALGQRTLYENTTGNNNIGIGYSALYNNTTAVANVGIGYYALYSTTTGEKNTAVGYDALNENTTGDYNTSIGYQSLHSNTTGEKNTGLGYDALWTNTTGIENSAVGYRSLFSNTSGNDNTAMGYFALWANTTGYEHAAFGHQAMELTTTGYRNTSVGFQSMNANTTGRTNTALGYRAFYTGTTYNNSMALGNNASISSSNQVRIGNSSVSSIGGYANWSNVSDGRFKLDVQENVVGLDFIMELQPVTYKLDIDAISRFNGIEDTDRDMEAEVKKSTEIQSGFIAQDVEKAANKVNYDFHGIEIPENDTQHYALRYAEFVVPLVKATQEQQHIIQSQKEEIEALKARLTQLENMISNMLTDKN